MRPGSLPTTSMVIRVMPWLAVRQGWKHVVCQLVCVSITMGTCCRVDRCRHRHQLTALFGPTCTLARALSVTVTRTLTGALAGR